MYEDFDKFLEYLEPKVIADGSVGFAEAIKEFWKINITQVIKEQVTGRLHATGKYLVVRGEETGSFLVRLNPNYELSEITKRTSFVQRKALKMSVGIGILTLAVTIVNIWLTLRYQSKQLDIQAKQQHLTPPPIIIDSVIVHQSRTGKAK